MWAGMGGEGMEARMGVGHGQWLSWWWWGGGWLDDPESGGWGGPRQVERGGIWGAGVGVEWRMPCGWGGGEPARLNLLITCGWCASTKQKMQHRIRSANPNFNFE
jgi:hypothetical protein